LIYLDTSAIVKLIHRETESRALVQWLDARSDNRVVTSVLAEVELLRALRRTNARLLRRVAPVLAQIDRFEIDEAVRAAAGAYPDQHLRSLDAIHLATADQLVASGKTLDAFVTYDKRLGRLAGDAGMPLAAPGLR